jgi:hypothetical protein
MSQHHYNVLLMAGAEPRVDYARSILLRPMITLHRSESVFDALLAISQGSVDLVVAEPQTPRGPTRGLADQLKNNRGLRRPKLLRVGGAHELAEPWPVPAESFFAPGRMADFDRSVSDLLGIGMRRHTRYLIRLRVAGNGGRIIGTTRKLSLGGMLLSATQPLPAGERITLELLDLDHGPLPLTVRVLRREPSPPDAPEKLFYAMEFLDQTPAQRQSLQALIGAEERASLAAAG